jgi:hypothetical protein
MNEPLLPADAKKLAIDALARGTVIFDTHVRERMAERKISLVDVVRVIRAGRTSTRPTRTVRGATRSGRSRSRS